MNGLFLRRSRRFVLEPGAGGASPRDVVMVQQEVENLGFVLDEPLVERLATQSTAQLAEVLVELRTTLAALTGAHRQYRPLFPEFPRSVRQVPEYALYQRAVQHYLTLLREHPATPDAPVPLLHGRAPRLIRLGSVAEREAIFTRLAASSSSLSVEDRDDLRTFVSVYGEGVMRLLPASIPFKENLALIAALLLRHGPFDGAEAFARAQLRTATDVLRLAVCLCEGDASLAQACRFKGLARRERRLLLGLLEACPAPVEDMLRWKERWKRLGEALHPGQWRERFPQAWDAFQVLREDRPFEGFNSHVEQALAAGHSADATRLLRTRPGELARRLDHLLRSGDQPEDVLATFARVAEQVSTAVLLQALAHFQHRGQAALRTFFPKGDAARAWCTPEQRPALPGTLRTQVIAHLRAALVARFATRPPLGRCYLDPALADLKVPLAQRSAAKALRTLVRGSRLPLPDTRFIRLFLWWTNGRERTDIDLSAAFFDGGFGYRDVVSFYNLRHYGGHHSGDIVDAPKGAAEFIDLDLELLRTRGIRFVVTCINSYTRQPYCDLPECFAGWMARDQVNSGEPFEARTVEDRLDLASDQQTCLPFILDLEARQVIWTDIGLGGYPRWNNVANNLSGIALMLRAMSDLATPDLHTLFELHAEARGSEVDDPAEADLRFGPDGDIDPLDLDRIRAEFL